MATILKKLFNVAVKHDFYVSGISRDFSIAPIADTAKKLANNQLLFRQDNLGFRVLYRAVSDVSTSSFIAFNNLELRFGMSLKNVTEFMNFTKLNTPSKTFRAKGLLYFTNSVVTTHKLHYDIIDELRTNQFTYVFPQTATGPSDTASIEIRDELGNLVTPASPPSTGIVPQPNNTYLYAVDLSHLPVGFYTFRTVSNAGATVRNRNVYVDNSLVGTNIFGIIKIKAINASGASFPATDPSDPARQYYTGFVRRETKWRYIVVPKLTPSLTAAQVKIEDGQVTPPAPYNAGPYTFTSVGTTTVNGIVSAVYESSVAIPFYEVPKKGLFVKNTVTLAKILDNVSNPVRNVVSALATDVNTTIIYVIV